MKLEKIEGTDLYTDGVVKYQKKAPGVFEVYVEEIVEETVEDGEDNWTYSEDDFVTLDEPVVLKSV